MSMIASKVLLRVILQPFYMLIALCTRVHEIACYENSVNIDTKSYMRAKLIDLRL